MTAQRSDLPHGQIILITGNMASGKSSVAQALAERLPRSVHLRGDLFRRMIVNGRAEMGVALSTEAQSQLQLRYTLAADVARRYAEADFTVVYQDIVIGSALRDVVGSFQPFQPFVVVLCPRPDVVAARDQARGKTGYLDRAAVNAFDQVLRVETPRLGYWLDNSDLTIDETVARILAELSQSVANPARIMGS
jgi:chloramphenicol 3-O-phosphotransferase